MNYKIELISFFSDYLLEILISIIIVFIVISLTLFLLTLIKRALRIRKTSLKARYQKIVDRAIFNYLFSSEEINPGEVNIFNFDFAKNTLFKKVAIKSIVSLHHSYSGEYQEKLESFYVKSKLVNYSIKKLDSKKWYHKIEAIRDLSSLNYQQAFGDIKRYFSHKNELVQSETLIAVLKLKGIDELLDQDHLKLYLNDWTQSNILFTVKSNKINDTGSLNKLLESENVSFQLLGVRLINHYNNVNYLNNLKEFLLKTTDLKLRAETENAIDSITGNYKHII